MEEERTGRNRGKKKRKERGRKRGKGEEEKCLSRCQRYLREDILSSKWILFLPLRNVFLQQSDREVQSEPLCMGLWNRLSVYPHRWGPPTHHARRRSTSDGMPKGSAEGDGEEVEVISSAI